MIDQTDSSIQRPPRDILQCPVLLLDGIFNSLEDAVFVVTPDRQLLRVNQAALATFGYSAAELADGSTAILHVDEQHYLEFGRRIQTAFQENRVARFEFLGRRKNGDIFPTEHIVSQLKDSEGKQLGIVSVVRDITARKQAEQQGYQVVTTYLGMERVPKAHVMGELLGGVLLTAEKGSGKVLGVQMLCPRAADIIHEATLAVRFGLSVVDLTTTVHVYPSISDGLRQAARENAFQQGLL